MGHVRSNSEHVSLQRTFGVVRSTDYPKWLLVTCPYDDCAETFLVLGSAWRKPRRYTRLNGSEVTIKGRACPYCFRASRLPSSRAIR